MLQALTWLTSTAALPWLSLALALGAVAAVAAIRLLAHVVATQERLQARDAILSRAIGALAAATSVVELARTTDEAMHALLAVLPGTRSLLALGSLERLSAVGEVALAGRLLPIGTLDAATAHSLQAGVSIQTHGDQAATFRRAIGWQTDGDHLCLLPLRLGGTLKGLLVVTGPIPVAPELRSGLERLAGTVALALGHLASTEEEVEDDRFRGLVHSLPDLLSVVSTDGVVRYQSPAVQRLLGYRPLDLLGTRFLDLLHSGDAPAAQAFCRQAGQAAEPAGPVVWRFHHQDGSWRELETVAVRLRGASHLQGVILCSRDVGARLFLRDPLTGAASKDLFQDRLEQTLLRVPREGQAALLLVDVDGLKDLNARLGFHAGDRVLRELAQRLRQVVPPEDSVGRLTGDRFALICTNLGQSAELEAVRRAEAIQRACSAPVRLGDGDIALTVGIGIAMTGKDGGDADALLRQAEGAVADGKTRGVGSIQVASPRPPVSTLATADAMAPLRRALHRQEFQVYYQPIANLQTGKIAGVEALVRWKHPEQGVQLPGAFLPDLEKSGLILPVGHWVLREACAQVRQWQRQFTNHPSLVVSVNLSPAQLQQQDLARQVASAVHDAGIDASSLLLEVSAEAMLAAGDRLAQQLQRLKDVGVRLALDDAAPGRLPATTLARLPLDVLKVDRPFVNWVIAGKGEETVGQPPLLPGEARNWQVVAEGIERIDQLEGLSELGCELVQGHLFARARSGDEMGALLLKASLSDRWLTTGQPGDQAAFWARMSYERRRELAVVTGAAQRTPAKPPLLRLLHGSN